MKWTVITFLLLLSCSTYAEARPWMKQDNPDILGLYVGVSSTCPFQEEDLTNRIKGEFLRARIKPTKSLDFNLTVTVDCMQSKNKGGELRGHFVSYEIRYGTTMLNGANVLYELPNYGTMLSGGLGSESIQFFINSIRDDVSKSLTDYLKANFE